MQRVLARKDAGQRADQCYLEAVKDPRDAEPDDDQPVPTAPRQRVEPPRDHRLHDTTRGAAIAGLFPVVQSALSTSSSYLRTRSKPATPSAPLSTSRHSQPCPLFGSNSSS